MSGDSDKISVAVRDLNRKFEEQETQRRAEVLHLPYFDLNGFPIDQSALEVIPQQEAEDAGLIAFYKEGPILKLGVIDPGNPLSQSRLDSFTKQKYHPEVYLVSSSALLQSLKQYKKIIATDGSIQTHEVVVNTDPAVLDKLSQLPERPDLFERVPVTEVLGMVLGAAMMMHSSDIHFEPGKEFLKIRFRVDGVLQDITHFPRKVVQTLLSRIKLLAGLKLNITTTPQDGRFSVKNEGGNLDLRVSVLPSAFGESVVIRILGVQEVNLAIDALALQGKAREVVLAEITKPNGMLLTTGPTGSGKTSTLYAFLNHINRPGVKIITLEDPIEYRLEGVTQTPIDRSAGMDFAKVLRSVLRQDPDIVMVGEIRDFETAETAAQAALTGHVVLSTLHTNDAAGAIPRLLDLGVKPVTLAPALNALMAQRLLRRICQHCREVYSPNAKELERARLVIADVPKNAGVTVPEKLVFYHSSGCPECHNLGYKGRIGIFEVFSVDEKIEKLIYTQATTSEIKKAAIAAGMLTMQQDGLLKALAGLTDLAEIWRVTEE